MRRNPSIHITLTDLVKVFKKAGIDEPETTAVHVMRLALPFAIKDRYIIKTDAATRKKVNKHIKAAQSSSISVEKFNQMLVSLRVKAEHKGVKVIRQGDSQYLLLKEVAGMACEFADTFGITPVEEACKIFIQLGLDFMKYGSQYGLGKFKYYREAIYAKYEAATVVTQDTDKERTREVYEIWQDLMVEYAGLRRELKKIEDYVNMVYVRLEADSVGADPEHWLRAQFEFFTFIDKAPNLNQLIGDKALARYEDWITNNHKHLKKKKPPATRDEFMKRYHEILRAKHSSKD